MKPSAIVRKYTISGIDNFSVEMLERLKEDTELYTSPQTKPLSDDEIENMAFNFVYEDDELDIFAFAKAIEERHGIK